MRINKKLFMSDVIKNACKEEKVPYIVVDKQKDRISFLRTCLSLNNFTIKDESNRLSDTECNMVAHMINFCIDNNIRDGFIEGKSFYNSFINMLIENCKIGRNSFPQYRKELRRKGVILNTTDGLYKIQIMPFLIKMLWSGSLNILVTSEK